ncbi:hypothetical protein FIBSPDRAFT_927823 [Athelia psychrophila]|uniref:Fatty acid hydroxylase domain-containing protein n=1 Tax=Athelia psychrophila TaxID=1759441 RepID=A0A166R2M8_9AGAM|nr:hypothetical protein FIBSPDRAFT_927823 [Fibularhizoctonia sp. CBS 109695]
MLSPTLIWQDLLRNYPVTAIQFWGSITVQATCFWSLSIFYTLIPYFWPNFSERHKLQKNEKQPTWADIRECALVAFRNQMIGISLMMLSLYGQIKSGKAPSPVIFNPVLPSIPVIARDIILGMMIREVLFYYIHRACHHKLLYTMFHKTHHRFTAPVALAATYATVTEHLFANILPMVVPTAVLKMHQVTSWIFLGSGLISTATTHSGYDFFGGYAKFHDLHHEKFSVAFGALGWLDRLHGTDGRKVKVEEVQTRNQTQAKNAVADGQFDYVLFCFAGLFLLTTRICLLDTLAICYSRRRVRQSSHPSRQPGVMINFITNVNLTSTTFDQPPNLDPQRVPSVEEISRGRASGATLFFGHLSAMNNCTSVPAVPPLELFWPRKGKSGMTIQLLGLFPPEDLVSDCLQDRIPTDHTAGCRICTNGPCYAGKQHVIQELAVVFLPHILKGSCRLELPGLSRGPPSWLGISPAGCTQQGLSEVTSLKGCCLAYLQVGRHLEAVLGSFFIPGLGEKHS